MIIWGRNLRVSEGLKKEKTKKSFLHRRDSIDKLKSKISKGKFVTGVYCICYSTNPENLLDIIKAGELRWNHYRNSSITIIGIAESKDKAEELTAEMINEVYLHTGVFDVRSYFK